jgi:hypothetical protein
VHRALPGPVMLRKRLRRRHTFFRDHAFECRKPMVIVGFSGIGIAGGLRFLDFLAKHTRPLAPGKQTSFVQRQRHGKRMGFPGGAKDRAVSVARNPWNCLRGAPGGFRFSER